MRARVICLPAVEANGRLDLAQIGANARRATEDTSTVGYIGEPSERATSFSRTILEAADVPQLSQSSGAQAMAQLLAAIKQVIDDGGSLRQSVYEQLR